MQNDSELNTIYYSCQVTMILYVGGKRRGVYLRCETPPITEASLLTALRHLVELWGSATRFCSQPCVTVTLISKQRMHTLLQQGMIEEKKTHTLESISLERHCRSLFPAAVASKRHLGALWHLYRPQVIILSCLSLSIHQWNHPKHQSITFWLFFFCLLGTGVKMS